MSYKYKLAPVTSFLVIQEALKLAHQNKELILIIAATGFGKTVSFNFSEQEQKYKYYSIRPTESSKSFFGRMSFDLSGIELKGSFNSQSEDWLIERSTYELTSKNNIPLVIIDEAGNFNKRSQKSLRQLWEALKNKTGMIISGPTKYLLDLKKWDMDNSSHIPEFVSRISRVIIIDPPNEDDIELVCTKNDISDKEVIKYIVNNSKHYRHVRNHVMDYHSGVLDLNYESDGF
jgi:hypothetical protein